MRLCDGDVIQPGSANVDQMYTLGKVIGHMHMILNSNHDERPLHWDIRSKDSMYELWNQRWLHANEVKCERTIAALEIQRKIIDEMDLELFSNCERGWAHWDLFVDNILFMPDSVSALLDFDRLNYVYPEFDLSRPILSCTLEHDRLHLDKVDAFVRGYREYHELSTDKLVRSIKLTWWKETEWVAVETEHDSKPIKRFREENIWVGENWYNLHDMLSAI